jgi:hypothetical protein
VRPLREDATRRRHVIAKSLLTGRAHAARLAAILCVYAVLYAMPIRAAAETPPPNPVVLDPFQRALYATCAASWREFDWQHLEGPRALAAGGRNVSDMRCFAVSGEATTEANVEAALAACRTVYDQGCSVFAENRSLAFWAQDIADEYRHKVRDAEERQYIRCSRPGLWERYGTAAVPVVMVVGQQGGDYRCYWAADKTYAEATARALGFCHDRDSTACEIFAVGGHLREKFLRAGDRLRGAKRDEYEYLYRSCVDPATLEAYRATAAAPGTSRLLWGEWHDKTGATGNGDRYTCRMRTVGTGPVAAEAALARDCHASRTNCLAIAYDMTLRPWAQATGDRLNGRRRDDAYYMLYACAMYDAEEHLDGTPPHRVLVGVHTKGEPKYDCLWQFGAPSAPAALAKLPCERSRYDCRLVASDGVLEAFFRPRGKPAAQSGLPRELLNSLAPDGADAPTLWPPGLTAPELKIDDAPPAEPKRQDSTVHRKTQPSGAASAPTTGPSAGETEH